MNPRRMTRIMGLAIAMAACGDGTGPGAFADGFPDRLSQVAGVPADLSADWEPASAEGFVQFPFAPHWPLWTNGAEKARVLVLPVGAQVNTADPASWDFPVGTMFFKTFSYRNPQGVLRHIETRIIRRGATQWETVAYQWDEDQGDARRLDGFDRVPVAAVRDDGLQLTHEIPNAADCLNCHDNTPGRFILGFNSRQLAESQGTGPSQVAQARDRSLLSHALADPPRVPDSTAATRAILGYIMGNCMHCHNGTRVFSMDPDVFMANTVGQGAPLGGTLIVPGQPDSSIVYQRVRDRQMPLLGVQVVDTEFVQRLREWIEQLN